MKNKRIPLYITLLVLDAAITVFLLVVSIVMLAKSAQMTPAQIEAMEAKDMISFFQKNPLVYGLTCVVPLVALFVVNIIVLILYVRKTTKKETVKVKDLSEDEKEALRQELLKDLQKKEE